MAVLLVAVLASVAHAKSFLDTRVGTSSIESALLSELAGLSPARLARIDEELRPMYAALPKNEHGRLDAVSVRYALHRYFMQKHGWFVNGLGGGNSSDDSSTILKERAPAYIQKIFEQRLGGQGLTQHDLAVFAATLTELIHSEVGGSLERVYTALELPTVGPVSESEYDMATKAYTIAYISGGREVVTNMEELPEVEGRWEDDFPAWKDTMTWTWDLSGFVDYSEQRRLNPFVPHRRTFEQQVSFLQELGHRLGTFQNLECHRLKDQLVELDESGTGRVPLSRFYRGGLDGEWQFTESVEYLRHVGALDDSNANRMSVIIPNYLQSQSNCLAGSSFYSVCCLNECEGLLGRVETEVEGPAASPSRLAAVISSLQSDTVSAPRNLSTALLARLGDIARLHGGRVPLHGRLFAQWLHHAYPRECPFPHVMGATNRMSTEEWMDAMDIDSAEASEEEMSVLVGFEDDTTPEAEAAAMPWTMAEELVAGHLAMKESPTSTTSLRLALAALALASLAPMAHRTQSAMAHQSSGKGMACVV